MSGNNKRIKIAFLTSGDPSDKRSWSGIDFYMAKALREHCGEVTSLGPMKPWLRLAIGKLANRASRMLLGKQFAYLHSFLLARGYAKVAARRLSREPFDLIFVPSAAPVVAFLETSIPIVYLSGTTFALMESYYPQFSHLLQKSAREGNAIEQAAVDKARLLLYPTEWPVRSAVGDYHADRSKIHVAPYGANLDGRDIPPREVVLGKQKSDVCRLLFLGVDWRRKGGEVAFYTFLELEKTGVRSELTVCGCIPPREYHHERMRVVPFLDKNDDRQRRELMELFLNSDFLLLPTRGDCFGIVFCEASAFGLPSVATNTGGVPGVVRDGENGFLLPPTASACDYAEVIHDIFLDNRRYSELVRSSRNAFEQRLNWDAWGRTVSGLLSAEGGTPSA